MTDEPAALAGLRGVLPRLRHESIRYHLSWAGDADAGNHRLRPMRSETQGGQR
jgi:hypothetical protein